tara:strand:+ start:1215 stop:1640 length:426 start_codon:yes stop_codon:yes gene_type:complete
MKMLCWINAVHRIGGNIRYRMATVAILLFGAIILLGAIGFCIAGGFLWLSMQMPDYLAALCVAGALFLAGAVVIALAFSRGGGKKAIQAASARPNDAEADRGTERILQAAIEDLAKTPMKAIVVATALGFVVGLLRPKKSG